MIDVLEKNRGTKFKLILNCLLVKTDLSTGEEVEEDPFFHSGIHVNLGTNLDEKLDEAEEVNEKFENFNKGESGWMFGKILSLEIHLVEWKPLEGSSWVPLPDILKNKNVLINPKNKDDECFKYAVTIGLKKMFSNHPGRITSDLRKETEEFVWSGLSFPTQVDEIVKFKKKNNVSVNVYCWNGWEVAPLKADGKEKDRHVDLLLLKDENKGKIVFAL